MYLSQGCAGIYASNVAQWESFQAGHNQAASPQFSMPVELKSVDPAWSACKPFALGVWDPPRTLSSVSAMDPTTQHIATTTPVASPGVSLTQPQITPTTLHAVLTLTENHDPKNTGDPKETEDPGTKDSPTQSVAASQADPAIDPSLGLRPSRTQDADSHSAQADLDPSAALQDPKVTVADDSRGTPTVKASNTEDRQHSATANQQASSGENTAAAIPVDLPVFDPMPFNPHHGSSHGITASGGEVSSKIDPAGETHPAHTKSTTDSAVDAHDTGVGNAIDSARNTRLAHTKSPTDSAVGAHDTGVGNAIDPAFMSKAIGLNNIFGAAAGASSTALGGEAGQASKSQSTDINVASATAAAHATDNGSQVGVASTHGSAGLGSDFDPQETAGSYTAATIVAQSSKPGESTEKVGSYRSLGGGFATTTRAAQSDQYKDGSTTGDLSASSSETGASNPSVVDGVSSSADDGSHRSPAKSQTPGSGRTNKVMSTSNSYEVLISRPTGISEVGMTSAVANGPQSTELTTSQSRTIARLTGSASTNTTGATASSPAPFPGQATRLIPKSAVIIFTWFVASAFGTNL